MQIIQVYSIIEEGYKECSKCHRILPLDCFHYYKPKAKVKTHRAECIECERLRNALKRAEHNMECPNYWNDYMKNWYATKETDIQKARRKLNSKKAYQIFKERHPYYSAQKAREYYYQHREELNRKRAYKDKLMRRYKVIIDFLEKK